MIFLDKDWEVDDTPQYFSNAIEEVYEWCSWKDVEVCINNPQFYELEFIDKGEKLQMPLSPRVWSAPHINKKDCYKLFEDGVGMIINNFQFVSKKKQMILGELERQFSVDAGMHVYCGLEEHGSFNIHEDYAHNFIIQIEGETDWTVYNNRASYLVPKYDGKIDESKLDVAIDVTMKSGDVLYIPARTYHRAMPKGKRLSLSIPMASIMYETPMVGEDRNWYEIT
tara:strand:- start:591 stop:1265 length:675 start_codon:yes stop_codon:yes gene_type:complete